METVSNMRVLFLNLGLLYVKAVVKEGKQKFAILSPVLEGSDQKNDDIISVLTRAHQGEPAALTTEEVEEYYESHEKLIKAIYEEISKVIRGVQATHGELPYNALWEKAVQDRIHNLLIAHFYMEEQEFSENSKCAVKKWIFLSRLEL